jgi:hypothetical protein
MQVAVGFLQVKQPEQRSEGSFGGGGPGPALTSSASRRWDGVMAAISKVRTLPGFVVTPNMEAPRHFKPTQINQMLMRAVFGLSTSLTPHILIVIFSVPRNIVAYMDSIVIFTPIEYIIVYVIIVSLLNFFPYIQFFIR